MGWHEIIGDQNTVEGAQHDQFIAKIGQFVAGTVSIDGIACKITPAFRTRIPDNRKGFGIKNDLRTGDQRPGMEPRLAQCFEQAAEPPRIAIELALVRQSWKQITMGCSQKA